MYRRVRYRRVPTGFSLRIKANTAWGCFYPRSPIAHGWVFIRAQSAIGADGFSSAQYRNSATTMAGATETPGAAAD
jgi:hypothetical protein